MTTNLTDPTRPTGGAEPRRRRWALVVAAAVTAAIAVPALTLVGGGPDTGPGDRPATSPSAGASSASPTSDPTTEPGAPTYDLLRAVTDGGQAEVPYLEGVRLVRPDGTAVELPRAYDQFALLGDRVLAAYDDAGNRTLDVLTSAGEPVESVRIEASFVVDAGGVAAWATPQGELVTMWPGGRLSLGKQGGGPVEVAAVTGDGPCESADDGCRVYLNNRDQRPPRWVAPDGSVGRVAPDTIKLNDVHGDLSAVQVSSSDLGSCSGVYDAGADRFLWKTCDNSLFRFSPGGTYLLASDPYLDGLGLGSLTVLDAGTGEPVVKFAIRGGFIAQQTWEDDTHPLVVISGPDGWEVLRLGLDGARGRVVGPVPAADDPTHKLLTLPGNH